MKDILHRSGFGRCCPSCSSISYYSFRATSLDVVPSSLLAASGRGTLLWRGLTNRCTLCNFALSAFAGGIRLPDLFYSGGVRQQLWKLYGKDGTSVDPDIMIVEGGVPDYAQVIATSKFCLAPAGDDRLQQLAWWIDRAYRGHAWLYIVFAATLS